MKLIILVIVLSVLMIQTDSQIPEEFTDKVHWFFVIIGSFLSVLSLYVEEDNEIKKEISFAYMLFCFLTSVSIGASLTYLTDIKINYPFIYRFGTLFISVFSPAILINGKKEMIRYSIDGILGLLALFFKRVGVGLENLNNKKNNNDD